MPPEFARAMEACDWSVAREDVMEAGRTLPAELVRRFGLAGTPETCRRQLRELLEAFPQIGQVVVVPFAPGGGPADETVRRFIQEVALEPATWT
jgi:5,10-methylenetetrahydromethanopterin reductase